MTVLNPPAWLQNAGATHTASQMRSYLGGLIGGVSASALIAKGGVNSLLGDKLQVTQTGSPSMAVIVKSGVAWIPGTENATQGCYGVLNDADVTLSIATAHATLNRIDIVCFKVEDSQYSGSNNTSSLVVVTGTPASSPAAPTAPANSLTLAEVLVGAAVSTIVNANITDRRVWLTTLTGSKLPDVQVFTSSGTWTKPVGAIHVHVRAVGGGGAGGGAQAAASGQNSKGGGGGGGGYSESMLSATSLPASVTIAVGAAGVGVSADTGGNGGNSTFNSTTVVANGGSGGTRAASSVAAGFGATGGAGGTVGTGQIACRGSAGENGQGSANLGSGGSGGNSVMGGGGVGTATGSSGSSLTGGTGGAYGGGGGGSLSTSTGGAASGGNGAAGVVIVTTYF